jgi:hypothetical protein
MIFVKREKSNVKRKISISAMPVSPFTFDVSLALERIWNETMKNLIEKQTAKSLFLFVSGAFFLFHFVQIPLFTSNADVLVYSLRALHSTPILKFAFLDERYLLGTTPSPNYHLAHSVILWLVYRMVPANLARTIWPSGLISAIAGALAAGLTVLISRQLGFSKRRSLTIAAVAGIIPSIWYHSLIGEVYALQLFAILLFLYYFLKGRQVLSTLAFLFACIVTPLSGLAIAFVFLKGASKKITRRAFFVALAALAVYLAIYYIIDPRFLAKYAFLRHTVCEPLAWRVYKLAQYVFINYNFLLILLLIGLRLLWREQKKLLSGLMLAALPQIVLVIGLPGFLKEYGAFQLPLFWLLAFPTGLALAGLKKMRWGHAAMVGSALITIFVWIIPCQQTGLARLKAGVWLAARVPAKMTIVGDWRSSIGVAIGKYDWGFEEIAGNYVECTHPTEEDLYETKLDSAIIVTYKWPAWRQKLADLSVPGLQIHRYDALKWFSAGTIHSLYENSAVRIYLWRRRGDETGAIVQPF